MSWLPCSGGMLKAFVGVTDLVSPGTLTHRLQREGLGKPEPQP
jgi:hypothetical protein